MNRSAALFLLGVMGVVACTPAASGPIPPRPTSPTTPLTTTTLAATTTTADSASTCPTDFCLVYHIAPEATWSDGEPVTSADFAHTVDVNQDSRGGEARVGYALIRDVDILDQKTVRVVFTAPHGAWRVLFDRVYRNGRDATDLEDIDTTGPFTFAEWSEGEFLTLERDPEWWAEEDPLSGDRLGDVKEIQFVFIDTALEMAHALANGEVDVVTTRPDLPTVESLRATEGLDLTLAPGPFWEHIDFHHEDPLLSQQWVREVFSLAIDREKIIDRTVRLLDPTASTQDSTVWMSNTQEYEPHFPDEFDQLRAERLLITNGCDRGEDGIYVCQGRRMSFVWASTNDDPARREIFESAREDLETVGIEVVADFRSPSAFVTRDFLFGGPENWQLVNFSWRARSDPYEANATYFCDDAGSLNVNRYCSEGVEDLVRASQTMVEPVGRASLLDRADRLYLDDLAVIPLYQKLTLMAWNTEISGPEPNFSYSTDLWNVASWAGKESIVVALPGEPVEIDPLSRGDDSANVIISALLYGAFGMTPSHEYLPVLIDSVDVIRGSG